MHQNITILNVVCDGLIKQLKNDSCTQIFVNIFASVSGPSEVSSVWSKM